MAVDTEAKRRSATQMPWMVIPPLADSTIDAQDRMHATGYYAGITLAVGISKGPNAGLLLGVYRS